MCGNRKRQYQAYGSCHRGDQYGAMRNHGGGGIAGLITILQQMNTGPNQQSLPSQPRHQQMSDAHQQTDGITYPEVRSEKEIEAQKDAVKFEVLPSYDESVQSPVTASSTSPRNIPVTANEPVYQTHSVYDKAVPHDSNTQSLVAILEQFRSSLNQYNHGGHHTGKWEMKRAAKTFLRDLYSQELEKRKGQKGYLECGERGQIKRELKPVKEMLRNAVWETKHEQKGY